MADFCRQCALELFPPNEPYLSDMAGISTPEDTRLGLFACVLCEGCGPTQVDHRGNCVAWDCYEKHGVKPPFTTLLYWYLASLARNPRFWALGFVLVVGVAVTAYLYGG